ncbi:hypothetical protein [Fervidibacillus halotolerans]|uniref:Uncharacterized protein n=1 Tax=Fervidibacillus halotolerans TaxID=2980027 RepID=A0A9E8M1T9_9BACI|nr:hypothetical protein [Fervidibacillus halotolerans]WAA13402.1 hypothetical protein OE105_04625 [Fervidibacillus halotolerans]
MYQEKIKQAQELKQTSAGWYRQIAQQAQHEISQAELNRDYSEEGRKKLVAKIRAKRANELMNAVTERKQEYIKLLQEAKADAEKVVKSKLKQPVDADEFKKEIDRLKVAVMLAPDAKNATEKIESTMQKIRDPYHASMLADEFSTIVPQVLTLNGDTSKAKTELSRMFERLNNDYLPADVKDAKEALEYVEQALANPKLFPPVVSENASGLFGREVARNINTPENYEPVEIDDDEREQAVLF